MNNGAGTHNGRRIVGAIDAIHPSKQCFVNNYCSALCCAANATYAKIHCTDICLHYWRLSLLLSLFVITIWYTSVGILLFIIKYLLIRLHFCVFECHSMHMYDSRFYCVIDATFVIVRALLRCRCGGTSVRAHFSCFRKRLRNVWGKSRKKNCTKLKKNTRTTNRAKSNAFNSKY